MLMETALLYVQEIYLLVVRLEGGSGNSTHHSAVKTSRYTVGTIGLSLFWEGIDFIVGT